MPAIVTQDLTREFNGLVAVDRANLEIEEGELFGLLGPNGAGKTTLIHMLCTILPPTKGTAKVWGFDIREEPAEVRRSIGIVFQDPSLDERLTGRENLDFHGRIYGMPKDRRRRRIEEVLGLVELEDRADDLVETYSYGMRRRLEVARGLMHRPRILFLDEPTLGLDPQTRRRIWDYIERLKREESITIMLTTHYMDEADHLCDRVGIIDYGRIVALDEPERLKDGLEGDIVLLEVGRPEGHFELLRSQAYVKDVRLVDGVFHLAVSGGERCIPELIKAVMGGGGEVRSVGLKRPSLEDVFIHHTGRRIREESEAGDLVAWVRRFRGR